MQATLTALAREIEHDADRQEYDADHEDRRDYGRRGEDRLPCGQFLLTQASRCKGVNSFLRFRHENQGNKGGTGEANRITTQLSECKNARVYMIH